MIELDFDTEDVQTVEFGVGRDAGPGREYHYVPAQPPVQDALREMIEATKSSLDRHETSSRYEPSEKHAAIEYVFLPIDDPLCEGLQALHRADNLPVNAGALDEPDDVFCYFVRLVDSAGRRLTGVKRATQFKGVLKKPLLRLFNDALHLEEDRVFKLDSDFDLLIDGTSVHVLRPAAFEFVGQLRDAVMAAAPENIAVIARDLPYVDFDSLCSYARTHSRAARYIASIRAAGGTERLSKERLVTVCESTGVSLLIIDGKVLIGAGSEMGFLEVLDRRRLGVELVESEPEQYRAASRQRLGSAP